MLICEYSAIFGDLSKKNCHFFAIFHGFLVKYHI